MRIRLVNICENLLQVHSRPFFLLSGPALNAINEHDSVVNTFTRAISPFFGHNPFNQPQRQFSPYFGSQPGVQNVFSQPGFPAANPFPAFNPFQQQQQQPQFINGPFQSQSPIFSPPFNPSAPVQLSQSPFQQQFDQQFAPQSQFLPQTQLPFFAPPIDFNAK